jgi:D-alanyl-D-alanine carboxypeptidase/D-alanyl-D-alanine-endopeptidase (penicillin-binding protein 4)
VTGRLIGDESLFDRARGGLSTNLAPDIPDFGGELSALTYDHGAAIKSPSPASFAAQQLAATLRAEHVRVRAARKTAVAPIDARPLAAVSSPPLQIMLRLMDVPSDDLFAELLTKQLGVRYADGTGSIAAGAAVIAQTIAADYGITPAIRDGSGLSRQDQSTPDQVVELLRKLWRTPTGAIVYASLPVVGVSGTVRGLALKTAAVGRCSAKTGTLDGVSNLAGYCHSRGHHALAFALFVDGPPNWMAIPLLERMVAAIARY